MLHKFFNVAGPLTITAAISACSSTDTSYRPGPWGQGYVRRAYPEYAAPWGRQLTASPVYMVAEPDVPPMEIVEIPGARPGSRREHRFEPDMGPLPPSPDISVVTPPEPESFATPLPAAPNQPSFAAGSARAEPQSNPPGVFTAPQRATSYAGTWNANVGATSCKVQLTSVPSLDLYKASAQGCKDEAVRSVNGWSFRENQVVLFSRGTVVGRLSGAEAALAGILSGSGSEIRMTR
ncbi:AprI/Inh family metalloprotease inhibitor [Microvirga calopogonii]|uniref:AprI/Inh family metalloprotease inhibitor n=1 Tax=Microvirga calopogonii TaxID=2078013 RepID=UPI000E0D9B17|nr:AprI/Inh family metalloprotease inhibitor [Microvirga calopogonii]